MIRSRTFRSAMLVIVVMPGSTAWLLRRAARDYGPETCPRRMDEEQYRLVQLPGFLEAALAALRAQIHP
jgi:hypothetical protein